MDALIKPRHNKPSILTNQEDGTVKELLFDTQKELDEYIATNYPTPEKDPSIPTEIDAALAGDPDEFVKLVNKLKAFSILGKTELMEAEYAKIKNEKLVEELRATI